MATKEISEYERILRELFFKQGREDSALAKYAKVRHTAYELSLWLDYGLPLYEVAGDAKVYFSKRFLDGKRIDQVDNKTLRDALLHLACAVGNPGKTQRAYKQAGKTPENGTVGITGCHERCLKLLGELNSVLASLNLKQVERPDDFLDWLTFNYVVQKDYEGNPVLDKPYTFEIRHFNNDRNFAEFKSELETLFKQSYKMSMQDIYSIIEFKRKKHSR